MILLSQLSAAFLVIVFIGMLLSLVSDKYISIKPILPFVVIVIVCTMAVAYCAWLGNGGDLARYYLIMNGMKGQSLEWAITEGYYKNTPLICIMMWGIAQTENFQLLPCISSGLILSSILYVFFSEKRKLSISNEVGILYIVVLFSVTTICAILTGVRQNMAYALMILAVYRDIFKHKRNWLTWILYISMCFVHTSGILLLVIRLAALLKGKFRYFIMLWYIAVPFFSILAQLGGVFAEAFDKLMGYKEVNSSFDSRYFFARIIILCVNIVIWRVLKHNKKNDMYFSIYESFVLFALGSIMVEQLFSRMITAVVYLSLPILSEYYDFCNKRQWCITKYVLLITALGLYAYHFVFIFNYWSFVIL